MHLLLLAALLGAALWLGFLGWVSRMSSARGRATKDAEEKRRAYGWEHDGTMDNDNVLPSASCLRCGRRCETPSGPRDTEKS